MRTSRRCKLTTDRPHDERMLVDAAVVTRLTGWHPKQVYRWAARGEIPGSVKVGRSVRFRLPLLLRWLGLEADGGTESNHATPLPEARDGFQGRERKRP